MYMFREGPVAQALGEEALATVAEQLSALMKDRRRVYEESLAKISIAQAQAKEVGGGYDYYDCHRVGFAQCARV